MLVKTQPFKEALELKGDGICFDIYGNGSKRLGDLAVTRAGLVWKKVAGGKPMRNEGINVRWEEFINWVQSRRANGGNGGMMKLTAQKGKPQAQSASRSGTAQKIAAKITGKSASGQKTGSMSASGQKIGGIGASTQKTGASAAAGQKPGAKAAAAPMKSASSMKSGSSLKSAGSTKSASPLKIGSKTIPTLKIGAKSATSAKPASKTGAAMKPASKTAASSRPGVGAGKLSAQNGSAVKLPTSRLPQSQAKGKTAGMAASKAASASRTASAARGRKAN